MKAKMFPLVFGMMCCAGLTLAGEEALHLSLAECESRGLTANRSLKAAVLNRDAARAAADAAYTLYLPSLSVSGGYSRTNPQEEITIPGLFSWPNIEDNFFMRIELKQNVFTGFKIQSAVSLAEAQYQVQDAAWQVERGGALYDIRQAYLGLSQALEAERITRNSLDTVRARLAEVTKRQGQGLATPNDVLMAELAVSQAEYEAADEAANVKLLRAHLNLLIGLPLETAVTPDPFISLAEYAGEAAPLERALEAAAANREELHSARGQVAAGEAGVASAAAGLYPALVLKGNYTLANPNPAVFPRQAAWNGTWEIGAVVSIDLGAYPQTVFRLDEAQRRLSAAQMRYEAVREGIEFEVLAARLALERSDARRRTAEKMFAQAGESRRMAGDKFKNGQAVLSDVLDADIVLLRAELLQSRARLAALAARQAFFHKQGLSWRSSTR
jgi:outer membrane protein